MVKKTFMRCNKELLKDIQMIKLVPRESYADVIKRLIEKERRIKK